MGKRDVHPKRVAKIDPYLRSITEAQFQARVVGVARENGFKVPRKDPLAMPLDLVYHTHDSRLSVPGLPDLVLCKPVAGEESGRVIFAELKREPTVWNQNRVSGSKRSEPAKAWTSESESSGVW